jgi:hypothetical protein
MTMNAEQIDVDRAPIEQRREPAMNNDVGWGNIPLLDGWGRGGSGWGDEVWSRKLICEMECYYNQRADLAELRKGELELAIVVAKTELERETKKCVEAKLKLEEYRRMKKGDWD